MAPADLTARYHPDHPAAFDRPPVRGGRPERIVARRAEDGALVEVHRLGGLDAGARESLLDRLRHLGPPDASMIVEIAPDDDVVVTRPLASSDILTWLNVRAPLPGSTDGDDPVPSSTDRPIAIEFTRTIARSLQRPGVEGGRPAAPATNAPNAPAAPNTITGPVAVPAVRAATPPNAGADTPISPDAETPPRGVRLPPETDDAPAVRVPTSPTPEWRSTPALGAPRPHRREPPAPPSVRPLLILLGAVAVMIVIVLLVALFRA